MRTPVKLFITLSVPLLWALSGSNAFTESESPESDKNKPLVTLVFDQTCHAWCEKVRPVMAELQIEYKDKVAFAELDATDNKLVDTKKHAKALGIERFFSDATDYVPIVMIFTTERKLIKELTGPKNKKDYEQGIEKAIVAK